MIAGRVKTLMAGIVAMALCLGGNLAQAADVIKIDRSLGFLLFSHRFSIRPFVLPCGRILLGVFFPGLFLRARLRVGVSYHHAQCLAASLSPNAWQGSLRRAKER